MKPSLPTPIEVYWSAYGRWKALFSSVYFWISAALSIFLVPAWDIRGREDPAQWVELAFIILPSMISFSLGAIAILVSLSSGKFFHFISEDGDSKSFFMQCVAAFCHFALVQIAALLMALIAKIYIFLPISLLGFFFLVYAVATGVAAIFSLITIAYLKNLASVIEGSDCDAKRNCDKDNQF